MKLISLNTWGCRITEPLSDFIKSNSATADIFCFQEVLKGGRGKTHRDEVKSGYEDIGQLLPNHTAYFSEYGEGGYYSESSKNLDFKY
jgi:exonuclease III